MKISQDTWGLIAIWAVNFVLFGGVIFRTRRSGLITLPVLIVALFFAMPKAWWWVPGVFIAVWAAFLATVRLRGLVVPEMKKINRFINGAGIAEIAVAVLLLVFRLHDLYGAILIGGIVFVALALVLVFPMIFWVVAAHLICPLLVRERISCSSKWVHCDTQLSNRRKVSIFYVRFDGDPAEYRVGWLYYRKCKRAALGGRFTYEKCVCPMGVSWIRNVREWG